MYELMRIWIHTWIHYLNSHTGHFLVPPKHVWFHEFINASMNLYLNSWYEYIYWTFLSWIHTRYHEFWLCFTWKRSYSRSCLKNIVKNIVKTLKSIVSSWKFKKNYPLNSFALCSDAQCLTGPANPASAAPAPPASLSAGLFCLTELQSQYLSPCLQFWLPDLHCCINLNLVLIFVQTLSLVMQAVSDQFKFSPVTSVQIHFKVGALPICYITSVL